MPDELSILVVEDDDDIRQAISLFLEAEGYRTVEARDGDEALRLLRSPERFCLVLLDLFMPGKNGWEFRAEQLSDPAIADIPLIVISADRSAPQKAATLGAIGCMVKPIDFSRLLDTVATHC
ncbi:MAG: response regulator [Thermodesulfobacteriota bacterium]